MNRELILIGGGDYRKNENIEIDDYISKLLKREDKILIIPFAVKEEYRRENRVNSIKKVFNRRGFFNFDYLNERLEDLESMEKKISSASAIFITGGDPKLLIKTLKNVKIIDSLKKFEGIIIGYSAGAMIFRNPMIILGGIDEKYERTESINLGIDFYKFVVSPHYLNNQDFLLLKESRDKSILAIADKSAVIFKGGRTLTIGEIFIFENMTKDIFKSS